MDRTNDKILENLSTQLNKFKRDVETSKMDEQLKDLFLIIVQAQLIIIGEIRK